MAVTADGLVLPQGCGGREETSPSRERHAPAWRRFPHRPGGTHGVRISKLATGRQAAGEPDPGGAGVRAVGVVPGGTAPSVLSAAGFPRRSRPRNSRLGDARGERNPASRHANQGAGL